LLAPIVASKDARNLKAYTVERARQPKYWTRTDANFLGQCKREKL
jgi:hypothetical protein